MNQEVIGILIKKIRLSPLCKRVNYPDLGFLSRHKMTNINYMDFGQLIFMFGERKECSRCGPVEKFYCRILESRMPGSREDWLIEDKDLIFLLKLLS